MADTWQIAWASLSILVLTFLSDVTELAFSNLLFFISTLRFWLYFGAHFVLSVAAGFLLSIKTPQPHWYILSPLATFLGVGLFARTNIEIAGVSLAPIGKMFAGLKAKMLEQAGEAKADKLALARLIHKLQRQPVPVIESLCRAGLMAARMDAERVSQMQQGARLKSRDDETYKAILIEQLIKRNRAYAEDFIRKQPRGTPRETGEQNKRV